MKTCTDCKIEKDYTEFFKQPRNTGGLFHQCKNCVKVKRKRNYEANIDKYKSKVKEYYNKNKQYYITKGYLRAKGVKQAQPSWLTTEHKQMLEDIYQQRNKVTEETGVLHHVDHIIPLKGDTCCGLHVPWNLQVIPATENLSKANTIGLAFS